MIYQYWGIFSCRSIISQPQYLHVFGGFVSLVTTRSDRMMYHILDYDPVKPHFMYCMKATGGLSTTEVDVPSTVYLTLIGKYYCYQVIRYRPEINSGRE